MTSCTRTLTDLPSSTGHRFRIVAVNKAGRSNPSSESSLVLTLCAGKAPRFDGRSRTIVLMADQDGKLNVELGDWEPKPTVEWTKSGRPVSFPTLLHRRFI